MYLRNVPIIEAGLSLVSIWWSVILFANDDMFNDLPKQYEVFGEISQETGWGIFFVIAAFIKVAGLVWDKKFLRITGLYMSTFLYALIATGYILSDTPLRPGTGIHFTLMIFALWTIREVRQNVI